MKFDKVKAHMMTPCGQARRWQNIVFCFIPPRLIIQFYFQFQDMATFAIHIGTSLLLSIYIFTHFHTHNEAQEFKVIIYAGVLRRPALTRCLKLLSYLT